MSVRDIVVSMAECLFLGLFGAVLLVRWREMDAWHTLRKEVPALNSLKTWKRKVKIALCYPIAFFAGGGTALRWASPLHDPFWRVRLWWQRLWVRKDEFRSSLDMEPVGMCNMTETEKGVYLRDLARRRQTAYEKDMQV